MSDNIIYQFIHIADSYYAAQSSGLYCSRDQGQSWHSAYTSLGLEEELATLSLAAVIDGQQQPVIFAGLSGELLRSPDNARSWELLPKPSPAPVFTALAASPNFAQDGLLFAGTLEDGVLLYRDGGTSYAMWNFGLLDTRVLCLAISPDYAHDQTLFVGMQSGLFCSSNGGRSWQEIELPCGYQPVLSLALSPDFATDETLYAGTEEQGIFYSQDRGRSWQAYGEAMQHEPVNSILLGEHELLILSGDRLLLSSDRGKQWHSISPDQGITAILAPHGLGKNTSLLIGYAQHAIHQPNLANLCGCCYTTVLQSYI